jgi:hypothetical protein
MECAYTNDGPPRSLRAVSNVNLQTLQNINNNLFSTDTNNSIWISMQQVMYS